MNSINLKLAFSPVPSFRLTKKLEGNMYCCLACAGKELEVSEFVVDYIIRRYNSAAQALDKLEESISFYWHNLPATLPERDRMAKKMKLKKILTALLQDMNDIHGESIRSLRHPHYYVSDYIYFHNFGHRCEGFDDYVRRGQLMLFYTNPVSLHVIVKELKDLMANLRFRRADPHLYYTLQSIPREKIVIITLHQAEFDVMPVVRQGDVDHIYFNALQVRSLGEDRTRLVLVEDSLRKLENGLVRWKRSFEEEVTLIIIRYLPHLEQASGEIHAPSAVPWLKLLKKVFGTIEDKMIFFMVNLYDFSLSGWVKPSPQEVDSCVLRKVELGSKIKIISVDGAVTDKEEWKLLGTKTTF